MPAIKATNTLQAIDNGFEKVSSLIYEKMVLRLTEDEFADAFIRPEHITHLRIAASLCGAYPSQTTTARVTRNSGDKAQVRTHYRPLSYFIPFYVRDDGTLDTCSEATRSKITEWYEDCRRVSRAVWTTYAAFSYLNDKCADAATLSLMVPSLPAIMAFGDYRGEDGAATKRAQKLNETKKFGALPKLPAEVKQAISEASAAISPIMMLRDMEVDGPDAGEVLLAYFRNNRETSVLSELPGAPSAITC